MSGCNQSIKQSANTTKATKYAPVTKPRVYENSIVLAPEIVALEKCKKLASYGSSDGESVTDNTLSMIGVMIDCNRVNETKAAYLEMLDETQAKFKIYRPIEGK